MPSFNYIRNSSKDIYKPNRLYTPQQGTIIVNEDTTLDVELEDLGALVTVDIEWWAAPSGIMLYVDGNLYYIYETLASDSSTHTHKIPKGSTIAFVADSSIGKSCSSVSIVSGSATTSSNTSSLTYIIGKEIIVSGDCSISVYSSIEPS